MKIKRLFHGGIMVNYRCNAACRHCLFACSPNQRPGYVSKEKIRHICRLLVSGGIGSVHIGGGEPFLDFQSLLAVIRELAETGIVLDFIETNAFWASQEHQTDTLCISLDPFHAEYVPVRMPLYLISALA